MHAITMVLIDTLNLLIYRTFLDNRCKEHGLQPPNWKEWNYVHKKVDNGTSDSDTHTIFQSRFSHVYRTNLSRQTATTVVFLLLR